MKQPLFLSSALAERASIVRMEVLHLDDEAASPHPAGPSRLEQSALRRSFEEPDLIDTALAQIAEASVTESSGDLDCRFGVVFTNAKDQRILSLYIDRSGDRGAVEGYGISLRGQRLTEWLAALLATPAAT